MNKVVKTTGFVAFTTACAIGGCTFLYLLHKDTQEYIRNRDKAEAPLEQTVEESFLKIEMPLASSPYIGIDATSTSSRSIMMLPSSYDIMRALSERYEKIVIEIPQANFNQETGFKDGFKLQIKQGNIPARLQMNIHGKDSSGELHPIYEGLLELRSQKPKNSY